MCLRLVSETGQLVESKVPEGLYEDQPAKSRTHGFDAFNPDDTDRGI